MPQKDSWRDRFQSGRKCHNCAYFKKVAIQDIPNMGHCNHETMGPAQNAKYMGVIEEAGIESDDLSLVIYSGQKDSCPSFLRKVFKKLQNQN